MNLHSFQNKFRARRQQPILDEEEWEKRQTTDVADEEFEDFDGTAQLNRMIYVKKSFNLSKTQNVSSTSGKKIETNESFNLTLKLSTLADDISTDRQPQKSPEFPKDLSQRMFSDGRPSRLEASNPDLHSTDIKEYKIKVTPPKEQRDLSERKLSTSRLDNPPPVKKKSNVSDQPQREHSVKETKSVVTPRKQIDKSEKDLSVYNESNHAPKRRRHTDTKRIIVCIPQKRLSYSPVKPRQTLLGEFERTVSELRRNTNRKFQDPLFPANSSIIFNNKIKNQSEDFKFERVRQIYEKYTVKLYHHCDPATLIPGSYTSASLYCSLVLLADNPNRVANILENQELNAQGIYYVSLCKDGVWRYIVVDDFLPIRVHKKKHLLFLHTTNQYEHQYQVWAAIIEKAVAKVYGTYEDVVLTKSEGVRNIFKLLTGYPCSQYNLEENTGLKPFSIILESSLKQRHIVVLENIISDNERLKQLNLNSSFSYQVTGMDGDRLTLRNYSEEQPDRSYRLDDLTVFGRLLIFKHEDNFVYVSRTLRHRIGYYSQMQFELPKDSNCYLEVWQLNPVYFRGHSSTSEVDYQQGDWLMELRNISENSIDEIVYIRESGQKLHLHAGTYSLRVHVCQQQREYDFTVSYYGEHEITSERVKVVEKWQQPCQCPRQ